MMMMSCPTFGNKEYRKRLLSTKTIIQGHTIMLNDRKVKLQDIADTLKISDECVGHKCIRILICISSLRTLTKNR